MSDDVINDGRMAVAAGHGAMDMRCEKRSALLAPLVIIAALTSGGAALVVPCLAVAVLHLLTLAADAMGDDVAA